MFKLYAKKGAGSAAVEAVLAICGASYEIVDLQRDPSWAFPTRLNQLNPRGEVPTLILADNSVMTESAAILIHLADVFPQANLAPAVTSPLRPRYLRWMLFLATTVYMSDLRMYYPERYTADPAGAPGIKARAIAGMEQEFAILSGAIGKGPFILGAAISAVDIYAAMLATWVLDVGALFAKHPNIKALHGRVASVPAVAKVWARNNM
ncbi:MAG: glutathione S-transferase family protein [Pirellulales bacterium]|nr:glutathione S-transferase family protein [Pirellulales bacterium]